MAGYTLWSKCLGRVPAHCIRSRISPVVSQQGYSSVLQRPGATPCGISERETGICDRLASRLQHTPSTKINQISSSNFSILSQFNTCSVSSIVNICEVGCLSRWNNFQCRHFRLKNQGTSDKDVKSSPSVRHEKSDKKKKQNETPFFKLLFYGTSAALFSFYAFALLPRYHQTSLGDYLQKFSGDVFKNQLSDHKMALYSIVGLNAAVFMLWRPASLRNFMLKYFTISTQRGLLPACTSMLLAAFSHKSLLHLVINLYVLSSFVRAWEGYTNLYGGRLFPKDLMSVDKFLAFYLSAAYVASAGSLIVKHIGKIAAPSLGASGAILGLIGYLCSKMPDSRLSIAFIPGWNFSAENGMKGIALFDTLGLLLGVATKWRFQIFDHAAHLTGLMFGIWYARYGEVMFYHWGKSLDDPLGKRRK